MKWLLLVIVLTPRGVEQSVQVQYATEPACQQALAYVRAQVQGTKFKVRELSCRRQDEIGTVQNQDRGDLNSRR